MVNFKHFYLQCLNIMMIYTELAIFGLNFFKPRVTAIIYYPESSSVKIVDFLLGGTTIKYPYKRAIIKLRFKKQFKEYPWLLKH